MSSEERAERAAYDCYRIMKASGGVEDQSTRMQRVIDTALRAERLAALEEAEATVKARMEIERVTDAYGYDRERNNEREYIIDCIRALKEP